MANFGFWKVAQEDPEHVAVIEPDGRETPRASCSARRTGSSTRCGRWGCSAATPSPRCSPTRSPCSSCTWRRRRPGSTSRRSTATSPRRRSPTSSRTATPRSLVCSRAHRRRHAPRRRRARLPRGRALLDRRRPPASGPMRSSRRDSRTSCPADRARRRVDDVHLGHDGPAQGRPPAPRSPARPRRRRAQRHVPACSSASRRTAGRPPRRLAALPHGRPQLLHEPPPLRPHRRAHGQVDAGGDARAHRAPPRDDTHMVPTQFRRLLALPDEVKRARRRLVAAARDPQRRALPGRREAADARVVGRRDLRVLRRVRGRRHAGDAARTGWRTPAPSATRGPSRSSASCTTTAPSAPRARSAPST